MATNHTNEIHLIFGNGPVSKAVVSELLRQGKQVRVVNRSGKATVPAGVRVLKGDATDPASTREVCQGASVVYQCAQPSYTQWPQLYPAYQAGIIEGAAAANAKLVVAENLYMYGPVSGPIHEDLPFAATTRKGIVRAKMAQALMEAHKAGKVRATAGRASDFFGPEAGEQGSFGDRIIPPMLAGKKVSGLGNIDLPHTYSYVEDFGKGLAILGTHDEAFGQAWHISHAPTTTTRDMLTMFFQQAGLTPKIGATPDIMIKMLGLFVPVIREVGEMLYEFNKPFVVDNSRFDRAFGNIATPHEEAIRRTLAWYRRQTQTANAKLA